MAIATEGFRQNWGWRDGQVQCFGLVGQEVCYRPANYKVLLVGMQVKYFCREHLIKFIRNLAKEKKMYRIMRVTTLSGRWTITPSRILNWKMR